LPPGFGTIWTAVAVDLIGFGIVLPILPLYAKRFHTTSFQATLLVAAFSAASLVCSPLWGRVSDRFGRKPILLVSLTGTAIGSLVTGLAGGLAVLLVGRIIDGASGASVSVAQAAAADLAGPADRHRLFGLLGAAFGIGFVAGPALGSLAALGGPRLPFFVAAVIATVNTVVAARRLPETHRAGAPSPSRPGPIAALAGGAGMAPLLAVGFCALVAFSGFEATFALFGERRLGFGLASSAAVFTVVGAAIVVVQGGLVHRVVARVGEEGTLFGGLALNGVGLTLLAPAHSWALVVPALIGLTVGQGLVQTTMVSRVAGRAGAERRGRILGAQQSVNGLARVVGPAVGGALLGSAVTGLPYLLGAALSALAAALLVWADRRERR
jgi:MFS family permease